MDQLIQDVRYAVRTLAKTPGFTLIAALTLALGIGVNVTVFSCVNALFLRPYPYRDPARLVAVRSTKPSAGFDATEVSYPNFADWRAQSSSFDGLIAHTGRSFNLAGMDEPERLEGAAVSWNTFRMLGVAPLLGREFREEEDRPGGDKVVLLSAALWKRRFGGDSSAVGRVITLNSEPYTIIGVIPPPHQFPENALLWVPLALDPTRGRGNHYLEAVGRLKPGVSRAQAQAELAGISRRLEQAYPDVNTGWSTSVVPLREHEVGEYGKVLAIMMGAVAFVLLIACANVANLLLARATARHREMAIRATLGAGRLRIVRQLLTESVLVALAGATLGIVIALWGLDLIVAAVPSDRPFWMVFTIDHRVLLFALAVAVGTGVLFGLAPALQAVRTDLHESLKEGSRGAGASGQRQRLRSTLVVSEVALSLVLLVGAALMIRSFLGLARVEPGFDRHNVLSMWVYLAGAPYDSLPKRTAFFRQLVPRLAALPGVVGVTATPAPPLSGNNSGASFTVEGQPVAQGDEPHASWRAVLADYFATMRIPVLRGREITAQDLSDSALVAVINQTMARRYWPGEDAVGKRFRFGNKPENPWFTVIGVARDVKRRLTDRPENQFYVPYSRAAYYRAMAVLVRTTSDPGGVARAARETVRQLDPTLALFDVETMDAMYRSSLWEQRLYGWMFGSFAGVALFLAAVGLYGVMAYMVTLRTHEIGVRMALGAQTRDVLGLVVGRSLRLAGLGVAIGLAGAFVVTRVLASFLFGVGPTDPTAFVGIPLLLASVAVVASWLPARRAARVDPVVALRYE